MQNAFYLGKLAIFMSIAPTLCASKIQISAAPKVCIGKIYVKWQTILNCLFQKSAIFAKSSRPISYEMIKAARAARKKFTMANKTQLSTLKIANFCQIIPTILCEMIKPARAERNCFFIEWQSKIPNLISALKVVTFRQIVTLIFPSDDKGRTCSAEKFFIKSFLNFA